jgi:hypothetical protein
VIVLTAFIFFALSGLLIGFAVGAFTRFRQPQPTGNKGTATVVVQTQAPKPTATVDVLALGGVGCPSISQVVPTELADGKTSYTFSAQAQIRDPSGRCQFTVDRPLHASGITCKLWLIQRLPKNQTLLFPKEKERLTRVELTSPLTGTIQNTDFPEIQGLRFDSNTPQTQLCTDQGQATWTYTVAPSVAPGDYDLLVLTDWQGKSMSWSWVNIAVKKAT